MSKWVERKISKNPEVPAYEKLRRHMKRKFNKIYKSLALKSDGHVFCLLFNFRAWIRSKSARFAFSKEEQIYVATEGIYKRFFYEKNRISVFEDGVAERGLSLGRSYFLERIRFSENDVVIDCGANVGDLEIFFREKGLNVVYYGLEPSPREYECLSKNVGHARTFNIGLWKEDGELDFYVSSAGADSSFIQPFAFTTVTKIQTKRLDSIFRGPIKLLKIEAEGAEPEVLWGAEGLLAKIEYISADLGFERGVAQESTLVPVTNFLMERNFELLEVGYPRIVALFRNRGFPLISP